MTEPPGTPEKRGRRRGQPTKFTPPAVERFLQALRDGASLKLAAAHAGWGYSTLMRYLDKGRRVRKGRYREFWRAAEAVIRPSAFIVSSIC